MPEFLELVSPQEALARFLDQFQHRTPPEWVETSQALDRVTYGAVQAPHPLPSFNRSTVDGYAVRAEDTYGASESLPAYLHVIGEIKMGASPEYDLRPGECAVIHTGGMLPASANAVVMLENTQLISPQEVEIYRAAAPGENVLLTGEDVKQDDIILPDGKWLRPVELGGLAALGILRIRVSQKPRVAILSSGDEIVSPESKLSPGKVRDVNTYTLQALTLECGGIPISYGILPDHLETLTDTAQQAIRNCDLLVITAGSSASTRDLTAEAINRLGPPGVLVHGINIRPGKPTILAACQPEENSYPKPVIGLPGNPVSAFVIARLFVKPTIHKLLGLRDNRQTISTSAELTLNLASQAGREDWVPVKLIQDGKKTMAEPVFGKSNFIFTLVRADGLVRIPAEATGVEAGAMVEVYPL